MVAMGEAFYLRFFFSLLIVIIWLGYLPCYWLWFVRPLTGEDEGIRKFKALFKTGALILAGLVLASLVIWAVELALADGRGNGILWPSNSVLVLTIGLNGLLTLRLGGALGKGLVKSADWGVVVALFVTGILVGIGEISMEKVADGLDGRYLEWKWFLSEIAAVSVWLLFQRGRMWLGRQSGLDGHTGRDRLSFVSWIVMLLWGMGWLAIPNF